MVLSEVPAGAVAPKLVPVTVMVGAATPGPWVPLNDTEEMLGRGAAASAALAVSAGMVARARAAVVAAASTAAAAATGRLCGWQAG